MHFTSEIVEVLWVPCAVWPFYIEVLLHVICFVHDKKHFSGRSYSDIAGKVKTEYFLVSKLGLAIV